MLKTSIAILLVIAILVVQTYNSKERVQASLITSAGLLAELTVAMAEAGVTIGAGATVGIATAGCVGVAVAGYTLGSAIGNAVNWNAVFNYFDEKTANWGITTSGNVVSFGGDLESLTETLKGIYTDTAPMVSVNGHNISFMADAGSIYNFFVERIMSSRYFNGLSDTKATNLLSSFSLFCESVIDSEDVSAIKMDFSSDFKFYVFRKDIESSKIGLSDVSGTYYKLYYDIVGFSGPTDGSASYTFNFNDSQIYRFSRLNFAAPIDDPVLEYNRVKSMLRVVNSPVGSPSPKPGEDGRYNIPLSIGSSVMLTAAIYNMLQQYLDGATGTIFDGMQEKDALALARKLIDLIQKGQTDTDVAGATGLVDANFDSDTVTSIDSMPKIDVDISSIQQEIIDPAEQVKPEPEPGTNPGIDPNPSEDGEYGLNLDDYRTPSLFDRFPFCLPKDLISCFTAFSSEQKAPTWEVTMPAISFGSNYSIAEPGSVEIDLTKFDSVIKILRSIIVVIYIGGLVILTKKIMS